MNSSDTVVFEIKGERTKEYDKYVLSLTLLRFRTSYLMRDVPLITLTDDYYNKKYFERFLDLATDPEIPDDQLLDSLTNDEKNDELFYHYLFLYSDIWDYQILKDLLIKKWKNEPFVLKETPNYMSFFTILKNVENIDQEYYKRLANEIEFFFDESEKKPELFSGMPFNSLYNFLNDAAKSEKDKHNDWFNQRLCIFLTKLLKITKNEEYAPLVSLVDFRKVSLTALEKLIKVIKKCNLPHESFTAKHFFDFATKVITELNDFKKEWEQMKSEITEKMDYIAEVQKMITEQGVENLQTEYEEQLKEIHTKVDTYDEQIDKIQKEVNEVNSKLEKFSSYKSAYNLINALEPQIYDNMNKIPFFAKSFKKTEAVDLLSLENIKQKIEVGCISCYPGHNVTNILNDSKDFYLNAMGKDASIFIDFGTNVLISKYKFVICEGKPALRKWELLGFKPENEQEELKVGDIIERDQKREIKWITIHHHTGPIYKDEPSNIFEASLSVSPVIRFLKFKMLANQFNKSLMYMQQIQFFGWEA